MLAYNDIYGIAPLHIRNKNDESLFCYEIGHGFTPAFKDGQSMSVEWLAVFLGKILDILSDSRRLLLEEKRFLLDQELIFIDSKGEPCLLYYPSELCFDTLQEFKELVVRNLSVCAAGAGAEVKHKADKLLDELKTSGFDANVLRSVLAAYKKMALTALDEDEKKSKINIIDTSAKKNFIETITESNSPKGTGFEEIRQKLFPVPFKAAGLIFVFSSGNCDKFIHYNRLGT
jgi:uncharacterized protein (UPF0335 family)